MTLRAFRNPDGRWESEGRRQLQARRDNGRQRVALKEFAYWLGVSVQTIAELLNGEIRPGIDLAARMQESKEVRIEMRAWTVAPAIQVTPETSTLPAAESEAHSKEANADANNAA